MEPEVNEVSKEDTIKEKRRKNMAKARESRKGVFQERNNAKKILDKIKEKVDVDDLLEEKPKPKKKVKIIDSEDEEVIYVKKPKPKKKKVIYVSESESESEEVEDIENYTSEDEAQEKIIHKFISQKPKKQTKYYYEW